MRILQLIINDFVQADPNYANAYFGMASCQKSFGEYEKAL